MNVVPINEQSPYFDNVKQLGRKNSATLGFFPEGAFLDYARRRKILIAIDEDGSFLGYLAYRVTKMRAIIVHLCVDEMSVRCGIAKKLVSRLSEIEHRCHGIGLHCRRDFAASKFWPKAGFVPLGDKPGRSFDSSKRLTYWWLDHGHLTLFSHAINEEKQTKLLVVIDANIFFDFLDNDDLDSKESKALLADWLPDNFILTVTDELFNEINRQEDDNKRNLQLLRAQGFYRAETKQEEVDNLYKELSTAYLQESPKPSDISDIKQLSHAIAAGAQVFITRDNRLLDMSDSIFRCFNINILRPCDFVIRLDELENEKEYYPARLAGSLYNLFRIKSGQTDTIVSIFKSNNESKACFQRLVRDYVSNTNEYQCFVIEEANNKSVGFLVYCRKDHSTLEVVLLRLLPNSLVSTLAKHIVQRAIYLAVEEGRTFIKFSDPNISDEVVAALTSKSFIENNLSWTKACFGVAENGSEVLQRLELLSKHYPHDKVYLNKLYDKLKEAIESNNHGLLLDIEKALWPLKIKGLEVNNYIIPIKPIWALHLFDEKMAFETLFGAKPELALNCENVFYRAVKPITLKAPARILWYVSYHKKYHNSKQLRACSYLEDVILGTPKELFQQFRRLGVYEWKDLVGMVKGDLQQVIMALRFTDSEPLNSPLAFEQVQQYLLDEKGHENNFQGPVAIGSDTFIRLYTEAMRREVECK